jgi:phenylpyruvate tautomerase PptA (4-oxalocrotonate tautomerase family)
MNRSISFESRFTTAYKGEISMPIIEITYPTNSLNPEQRQKLTTRLTPLIAKWEGQPGNGAVINNTWIIFHEQPLGEFTVGAQPQALDMQPRYLATVKSPQNAFIPDGKQGLAEELTRAILEAEDKEQPADPFLRIWCIFQDVPDGSWSYGGRILGLREIGAITKGNQAQ